MDKPAAITTSNEITVINCPPYLPVQLYNHREALIPCIWDDYYGCYSLLIFSI